MSSSAFSILIIDDSEDDRELYIRALGKVSQASYQCLESHDGHSGLEMLGVKIHDCVLLDYSLPGMNGLEVLKKIREQHPFVPVILLTGQGSEVIAAQAIKEGAHDYLSKSSVDSDRLHHTITAAINQCAMARDIAAKDFQILEKTRALALSEERYHLAVKGLSVGIWDWDVPTNKLFWSQRFQEIILCTHGELKDEYHEWESRLHPDDRERTVTMLQGHLKKQGPYDAEYRLRREDGNYIWIHAKGQAVWNEDGQPTRMVGSIEEITWRKDAEVEREKMIARLMESNSELERFAYICSHDLQEPLRMISSFTQRLEKHLAGALDEKGLHYMKYITDGAVQARGLIQDVLNYARVEHETELLSTIESEQVLSNVLRDLSTRIEETGATVTHDPLPALYMQPTHLRQLLQNLIGNALKFCSETPQVHIGAQPEEGGWRFCVRDNGIGIAPEHMHKIFSIFQRLHRRERYPGTGIGLAICKKVTQKYGGKIWVESQPEKGSIFFFTLPAASVNHEEAA